MWPRLNVIFLLLPFAWISGFSQPASPRFEHIGTETGLSQSNVICILHDSRGFMWFGTRDGLNKYDGYSFTIYKNIPANSRSISNNFITGIAEDANGDLWIAAFNSGPRPFVEWVLIEEKAEGGDMLAHRVREDPRFLEGYSRVCEGAGLALYKRAEGIGLRATK